MGTIIHKSELVRRAVAWLGERMQEQPAATESALLDEAAMRFNLGPADSADLQRLFHAAFIEYNIRQSGNR